MQEDNLPTLRLIAGDLGFVRPYIEVELAGVATVLAADDSATSATYTTVVCPPADSADMAARYPGAAVMAADGVIGTGMTGWPMELASRVWRGTFFHVPGSEVPVAAIHATDLARAVALTLGTPGIYTVTDGCAHTLDSLADALAARLGDKRILTARPALARWLPGAALRRRMAARPVADGSAFAAAYPGFHPTDTTTYLRTHVYDENSL